MGFVQVFVLCSTDLSWREGRKGLGPNREIALRARRRVFNKASSVRSTVSVIFYNVLYISSLTECFEVVETETEAETHAALCRVGQKRRAISQFLIYLFGATTPYKRHL